MSFHLFFLLLTQFNYFPAWTIKGDVVDMGEREGGDVKGERWGRGRDIERDWVEGGR